MKIKTIVEPIPPEDLFGIQFRFEDFTDEEMYLFVKYGVLCIDLPNVNYKYTADNSTSRGTTSGKLKLDDFIRYTFLFSNRQSLENFRSTVFSQIQTKLKDYLSVLTELAGEQVFEISISGEVKQINEGARKALDRNSKEYKQIIESNREAFEKLSKL